MTTLSATYLIPAPRASHAGLMKLFQMLRKKSPRVCKPFLMKFQVGLITLSHTHLIPSPSAFHADLIPSTAGVKTASFNQLMTAAMASQAGLIMLFHAQLIASPSVFHAHLMPSKAGTKMVVHSQLAAAASASQAGLIILFHAQEMPSERRFHAIKSGVKTTVPISPMPNFAAYSRASQAGLMMFSHAHLMPLEIASHAVMIQSFATENASPNRSRTQLITFAIASMRGAKTLDTTHEIASANFPITQAAPSITFANTTIAPMITTPIIMPRAFSTGITTGSMTFHKSMRAPPRDSRTFQNALPTSTTASNPVFRASMIEPIALDIAPSTISRTFWITLPMVSNAFAIERALSSPNRALRAPMPASSPANAACSSANESLMFRKVSPIFAAKSAICLAFSPPKIDSSAPYPSSPPRNAAMTSSHAVFRVRNASTTGSRADFRNPVKLAHNDFPISVLVKNATRMPIKAPMATTTIPTGFAAMERFRPIWAAVAAKVPARCAASSAGNAFMTAMNWVAACIANNPSWAALSTPMAAAAPNTALPSTEKTSLN